MSSTYSYPPLDVPKPISDGLWIVDAAPLAPGGLPMPLRMSVVRLSNGDLLLHSPTRYSDALRRALEALGPIRHLVAPTIGHWQFLQPWQGACPEAVTWAVEGLRTRPALRKAGVRIDHDLGDAAPQAWAADLEQVLVRGPVFAEVDFFHRMSRTLLLTDLVVELEPGRLGPLRRAMGRVLGVVGPHGRAPLYVRKLIQLDRRQAARAAARLLAFAPERVIFAHGRWYERDGAEKLRCALGWLIGPRLFEPLDGVRVVITGASSGIGRATALAFAERGATVALAARREEALQGLARECEALGGRAIVIPTDVTDAEAVQRLARTADETLGGIDVWINNAGAGVFGPYQNAEIELHRRTVEINLLGTMHGAWAALPIFLRQRRGTLINNISLGGWSPAPFAAAYTASKFGLRGFTASLRQELADQPHIHVCAVFPAMVDTPGFMHGANMSGRLLDPGPLLYTAEDVAETFIGLVRRPRDEIAVGWPSRLAQAVYAAAPRLTEHLIGAAFRRLLAGARPAPRTKGALLAPMSEGVSASGGWLARKRLPSARPLSLAFAATVALGVGTVCVLRHARRLAAARRRTD